jgi:uncharacterized protein with PIN domain
MACNGVLIAIDKEEVRSELPPRTAEVFDEFKRCVDCPRVYWKGSHYRRMLQWVGELV